MPGTIERNIGNLHDQDTGKLTGYRNPVTNQPEVMDAAGMQNLVDGVGAGVSNVTYDGSNRCTGFQIGAVTYTVSGWGTSTVTVAGSDGSTREISLDGSGRISGVV